MSKERSDLEFARHGIATAWRDFAVQAQLTEPVFTVSNLASGSLIAAAQKSLVAIAEFGLQDDLSARIKQHLRKAIKLCDGRNQVQSLRGMLEEKTLFETDDDGWQSVHNQFLKRIDGYDKRLGKFHRRLVIERTMEQADKLLVDSRWQSKRSELELPKFAQATLNDALSRMFLAVECENPSVTLIHEFGDSLNDLNYKMSLYREMIAKEDWQRLMSRMDPLRVRTLEVDRFALLKVLCTKWLEKERQPGVSKIFRKLADECRMRYRQTFGQLADLLDSQRMPELHASFSVAFDHLVESK